MFIKVIILNLNNKQQGPLVQDCIHSTTHGFFFLLEYLALKNCIFYDLLLLLRSRFGRVRLCATPQRAAYEAPRSLGFSRQEHWSGLPFPSPIFFFYDQN